jgi:ribosomal protein S18 acetylase RimI-like enzyme
MAVSTIEIRNATAADAEGILDVRYQTYIETYPNKEHGITRADIEVYLSRRSQDESVAIQHKLLRNPDLLSLVALDGASIVAWALFAKDSNRNRLSAVYVLPDYQNQGVGTQMLKRGLAWLGDEKDIWLGVAKYNEQAIRAYEKLGFKRGKDITDDLFELSGGAIIPEIEMIKKAAK